MKSSQNLNVLYLTNNPNRESTIVPTEGWIKNLKQEGLNAIIITPAEGSLSRWAFSEKIPVYVMDLSHPDKLKPIKSLIQILRIINIAYRHRINLIHCNEQNVFPVGNFLSRIINIPIVVSIHFSMSKEFCRWAFKYTKRLKKIIFTSDANQRICSENVTGLIDKTNWMVLKNGIDLAEYSYDQKLKDQFLNSLNLKGKFIVGVACALRPRKQVEHLIQAVAQIASVEIIVLIAGKYLAEDKEYGENLISESKKQLGDRVIFLGHLDNLIGFYSSLDLFINTSTEEACSLSVIQALSCSCPVVGYPSMGTVSEQVLPEGGEIVAQDDIASLSAVIIKFMNDHRLRSEAKLGARKRVEEDYNTIKQSKILMEEYLEILKS